MFGKIELLILGADVKLDWEETCILENIEVAVIARSLCSHVHPLLAFLRVVRHNLLDEEKPIEIDCEFGYFISSLLAFLLVKNIFLHQFLDILE